MEQLLSPGTNAARVIQNPPVGVHFHSLVPADHAVAPGSTSDLTDWLLERRRLTQALPLPRQAMLELYRPPMGPLAHNVSNESLHLVFKERAPVKFFYESGPFINPEEPLAWYAVPGRRPRKEPHPTY